MNLTNNLNSSKKLIIQVSLGGLSFTIKNKVDESFSLPKQISFLNDQKSEKIESLLAGAFLDNPELKDRKSVV